MIKVFIVGGFGNLGQAICKAFEKLDFQLIRIGRLEVSRFLEEDVDSLVCEDDLIINAASTLGTSICEQHRISSFLDNAQLSFRIASKFLGHCRYCYISTEAVFGDNHRGFFPSENSLPIPRSWYAVTKLAGENYAIQCHGKVVRLPLLVDVNNSGTLFGKLINDLRAESEVEASVNAISTPLSYLQAANQLLVVERSWFDLPEIIHVCGLEAYSIYELLQQYAEIQGLDPKLIKRSLTDDSKLINGGLTSSVLDPVKLILGELNGPR